MEIRQLTCGRAISLERRPTTESGVNASLVVIGGESIQLAKQEATSTPKVPRPLSFSKTARITEPQVPPK
jgi:hypothetical protein